MEHRPKIAAAYLLAIPLALLLGILAASPGEMTFMLVGMLLFFLALPLLIKWHHALLIVFWNSAFMAFFLPGQPNFWLVLAAISFAISGLNYIMGRSWPLSVPEMKWPLMMLTLVILGTALYRGGIGIRSLGGSTNGGRYYIFLLSAIMGYFALTALPIPANKSQRLAGLFFLSGTTNVLSNFAYILGPAFYFIFYLIPPDAAYSQVMADYGLTDITRISGLGTACTAIFCFLLVRYGVRGLFEITKPWRLAFLIATVGISTLGGYRTTLVMAGLIFIIEFFLEGLLRTRVFAMLVGLGVVVMAVLILFSNRMPLSMQRSMSFVPLLNIDQEARADAADSTNWREQMWSVAWKEVPRYLAVGKGYSIDPSEMYLVNQAIRMGILNSSEIALLAGDYHSGPLSVLVPFGIPGVLAFMWVLVAGGRVLYMNFRFGNATMRRINSVLLAYYLADILGFLFIFGAFNSQLFIFLGVIGLSVSLNAGVKRKPKLVVEPERAVQPQAFAVELG